MKAIIFAIVLMASFSVASAGTCGSPVPAKKEECRALTVKADCVGYKPNPISGKGPCKWKATDNTFNICKANCEDPEYDFTCCAASHTLPSCHKACEFMVKNPDIDECQAQCRTMDDTALKYDAQRDACTQSCENYHILKQFKGREGLNEKKRAPIDIKSCDETSARRAYECTWLLDGKPTSRFWDNNNVVPNTLKLNFGDEKKLATSVILKIYAGFYPEDFKIYGTTDQGKTTFLLKNLKVDSETNFDANGAVTIKDNELVSMQPSIAKPDLELVFDPVMLNGVVLKFLNGQQANNRIIIWDINVYEEVTNHCPSGYFPVGTLSTGNYVNYFGGITDAKTIEDCKTRCETTNKCISFMYDGITQKCRVSMYRDVTRGEPYNTRLCTRSLTDMICPSGYNSVNSLFYLNDYSGVISGQGKLTVDTIGQCRTKCDEHHNCYAFNYNDEQHLCNLEQIRRANRHAMNTRWCSKPDAQCIAPYTQRGTLTKDNRYSKELKNMRNVRTVRDCQTTCDNEDACAAYRYDDEQQTCALHPSRSPNTYVGPNSLYCVQAVDYTYEGCQSLDFDPKCDDNAETFFVDCKDILDQYLPVDDRARHCQQRCLSLNKGFNYISIHDKRKCFCKKSQPLVKDTELDENACDKDATYTNVVYRIVVADPCKTSAGKNVCEKEAICKIVGGSPRCDCRPGHQRTGGSNKCTAIRDSFNVCVTGCERAEYEYRWDGQKFFKSCQIACEFSIQQKQTIEQCEASCDTVEDKDRLGNDKQRDECQKSCNRINELLKPEPDHKQSHDLIPIHTCISSHNRAAWECQKAFDNSDAGYGWDNNNVIPATLDLFWKDHEKITRVVVVSHASYSMRSFTLEYTTDKGKSWNQFSSIEADDSQFETKSVHIELEKSKVSMEPDNEFALNLGMPSVGANGFRIKVLDTKHASRRVIIHSVYLFTSRNQGCPDGYTQIGTLSQNNRVTQTGAITTEENQDRCARRCDLHKDCVAFMFDKFDSKCKLSLYRFPLYDEKYTQRFCARNTDRSICPPGYLQRGTLDRSNRYGAGIEKIDELPTIADCELRCTSNDKCRAFMYDDKTGYCQLENYRRAAGNAYYNSRNCEKPVEKCPAPYFQKGSMNRDNNYSRKTLKNVKELDSVQKCQQFCDEDKECAGYVYDDEKWLCETKPSRTPNTYKVPNSLFCAAPAPYEYVGCGSIDMDYECGEADLESLYVDCKPILDQYLPVDDRARHCYRRCNEISSSYNYIAVHKKTQCICKKSTPRIFDTTTDENDCGLKEAINRLNVIYRMDVSPNACEFNNGGCDKNAVCTIVNSFPKCKCRTGYNGNGLSCSMKHDKLNLCTARCENPEYDYKCCGNSYIYTLQACQWACYFMNGPQQQNVEQCEASCDVITAEGLSHDKHRAVCHENCNRMDELTGPLPAKKCSFTPIQIDQCKESSSYNPTYYGCAQAFDLNKAGYGWYSKSGDVQPTIEFNWKEPKMITRVLIVTVYSYNLKTFKVQHSMDLENYSAFQDFEVEQSQFPFDNARTEDGEKVYVDMKNKAEIELSFKPVYAKGIKIKVLNSRSSNGMVRFMEVYVYEKNCEVCPEGYTQMGTMSFNNKASPTGAKSIDETVEDCKLRCELLDKCTSFMYDNLKKECYISTYRYPNAKNSLTHVQRFCYRNLEDTICPSGYFQVGSLTNYNRVTKVNLDEELQVSTIHDCEAKCNQLPLCKAFTYDSHHGKCQAENLRNANSHEPPNTRMCAVNPLTCPPKYTQMGTLNSGNDWSGNGLGVTRNVKTVEECQEKCDDDAKCLGFSFNDELLTCEIDPSRTPNRDQKGSYLFCGQDINYEYMGCGSHSFSNPSCSPGADVFHVQCKKNLLSGTVENKAMTCYNYCSQLDGYNYMSVHDRASCVCAKTRPSVFGPNTYEEDCKQAKSDAVYEIHKRPCAINNGGCHENAECIELEENGLECACKDGYTGNGYNCEVGAPPDCSSGGHIQSSCTCGASECSYGQYCYNGACNSEPKTCDGGYGTIQLQVGCKCGRQMCNPGEYCYPNGKCKATEKPTPTCADTHLQQTVVCKCGTQTCPGTSFCYKGDCTVDPPQLPTCSPGDSKLQNACACNGQACGKGEYCYDGKCANTPNTNVPSCKDATKISSSCKCGDVVCGSGTYCYDDQCQNEPYVAECQSAGFISTPCECGTAGLCGRGTYCYDDHCNNFPRKCSGYEVATIPDVCMCAGVVCTAGLHCWTDMGREQCTVKPKPQECGAGGKNEADCMCGTSKCSKGYYCWPGKICVPVPPVCGDHDTTPIPSTCLCGGSNCGWGKFCVDGKCSDNKRPSKPECDLGEVASSCMCGEKECSNGEFCYDGKCNVKPSTCVASPFEPLNYACDCGGVLCDTSLYCYDGMCHDEAREESCESSATVPVASDCHCGTAGKCPKGNFCHQMECSAKPFPCEENAFLPVKEKCMCGPVECTGYCFDGLCEDVPRPKCTTGLVVTDDHPKNYGPKGARFGVDDAAATKFFGTSGWSLNTRDIITSRGYRGKIKVWKNSRNCGNCGRYHPYSEAERGDWQIGDVICQDPKNPIVHPKPEPHPIEKCAESLQVTHSHPGSYSAAGRYFGFDNKCANKFFGTRKWHNKAVTVMVKTGTHANKPAKIHFFKDGPNCKMSCGRWSPYALTQGGDWKLNDLIYHEPLNLPDWPIEKCESELLVTHNWPGLWKAEGQFFNWDNECMTRFLGTSEWHYKKLTVLVNGDYSDKRVVRIFKDSSLCGHKSCGRLEPIATSKKMDWNAGDILRLPSCDFKNGGCNENASCSAAKKGRLDCKCKKGFAGDGHVCVRSLPPHPIELCKKSIQVTDNWPGKWGKEGQFFGFDAECATVFWGKSNWDWKRTEVVAPDGSHVKVVLFKNKKGTSNEKVCGGKPCGRIDPRSKSAAGDWPWGSYVNKIEHDITPLTIEECKTSLQVIGIRPVSWEREGKWFEFNEACMDAFYGATNWGWKKLSVKVGGKTRTIKVFKKLELCEFKSCGRVEPKNAAAEGDWSMGDILMQVGAASEVEVGEEDLYLGFNFSKLVMLGLCATAFIGGYYKGLKPSESKYQPLVEKELTEI